MPKFKIDDYYKPVGVGDTVVVDGGFDTSHVAEVVAFNDWQVCVMNDDGDISVTCMDYVVEVISRKRNFIQNALHELKIKILTVMFLPISDDDGNNKFMDSKIITWLFDRLDAYFSSDIS